MVRNQQELTMNGDFTQASTTKHSWLYFDDGSLILKATAVLFRIHWGILRAHSSFFYETFIVPCFSAGRGNTESTPLVLQDVASSDLESFLSFFYPSTIGEPDLLMSVEKWTSVLVLASQWHFSSLRDHAIQRLEQITTPAQRISLAKTQHIPKWLVPAYIELCSQKAPLERSDARLLGLDDVLAIWEVQHELARGPLYEDGEVRQLVEAKFASLSLGEQKEPTSPALTLVNGHVGTGSTDVDRTPPSDAFVHIVGPASAVHGLPVDAWVPTPSPINLPLTEISPHPHDEHDAPTPVPDKPSSVFLSAAPTSHVHAEATISLSLSTPQVALSTLPSSPESPIRTPPLTPEHVRLPPHAFSRTQSPNSLSPSPSSTPTTMFSMTPHGLVPRRVAGPERQQGRLNGQGNNSNNNNRTQPPANGTDRRGSGAAAVKQAALSAKRRKKAVNGTSTRLAAE